MNYNNGRLGVAREVSDIPDGVVGNDDNIYVFCKKCDRELPHTIQYFPEDRSCKTGLRYVCRECNPSYGRFLEDNEEPNRAWSNEDDNLILEHYHDYTGKELKEKFFPYRSVRAIECHAGELGIAWKTEETYKRSR